MAGLLLLFVIFWILLVNGLWALARYLIYRTGRRPAVFERPWLRRMAIMLLLLIPFYGAIFDSLTFELACQLWGREIVNEPRQAEGFEGIYVDRWKLLANGVFQFADVPTGELHNRRYFLAEPGDPGCESFQAMLEDRGKRFPEDAVSPQGRCMAVKDVPAKSARYAASTDVSRRLFKEDWLGHRLYKYETIIYDRSESKTVGSYRQLMSFRDSFLVRYFFDDAGRHTCGQRLVRRDGVLRTLAPQTAKGDRR